ncbi:hypothetical protein GCM10009530_75190 [Microbispora corallina]
MAADADGCGSAGAATKAGSAAVGAWALTGVAESVMKGAMRAKAIVVAVRRLGRRPFSGRAVSSSLAHVR